MVGATMDSDDLLKRVRAIPGVMEASIMHGRQRDRLYVKVASGTVHALLNELKALEADLHVHIHLENNILFPSAIALEQRQEPFID